MSRDASSGARLVAQLTLLQRRATIVTAARHGVVLGGIAVGATALVVWLRDPGMDALLRTLLGLLVLVLVAAGTSARLMRPALAEVARTLDRRLRLDDHLTSALQFTGETDPFAQRVVDEALVRAELVRPAVAYPLRLSRPDWTVALTAAALPLLLVFAMSSSSTSRLGGTTGTGGLSSGRVNPDGAPRAGRSTDTTLAPEAVASAPSAAPPPSPETGAPVRPPTTSAAARSPGSPSTTAPDAADAAFPRPTTNTPSSASPTTSRPPGSSGSVETGDTGAAGGGAGAGAASMDTRRSGGASASDRPSGTGGGHGAAPEAAPTRDAWAAGERAMARDHIPPGRRESVRRYFVAIRPSEHP